MSAHGSVWLATAERATFPVLDDDVDVDVAVIGAGITGLTTAVLLQRDGAQVALADAGTVGGGTTAHTTGKVTSQHSLTYRRLIEKHGEAKARLYADANQQAIETMASLAEGAGAGGALLRASAFAYTTDPALRSRIEAEHEAAVRLGLPAMLTTETDLPASVGVQVALRFDDQAHVHPVRYTDALVRAFAAEGGLVFEQTRALAVDEETDHAVVHTTGGDIRARHVVLATLLPFVDIGGFFAKARPTRVYGVAATLRGEIPAGMHITVETPTRSTAPWRDGDRGGLIVVGGHHPTGEGQPTPGQWGDLEGWTRDHFDVDAFEYRWSAQDFTTADDVPYVGRSPRTARTFVATGFRKWGLTNGTAAAELLAARIAGREHPWLQLFDATRIGSADTVTKLVKENLHVGKRFVTDRLARLHPGSADHLDAGQGGMVEIDGHTVGAYRGPEGKLQAVSITCTHMGCTLRWNAAETSWDCPCHGSRFGVDGAILDGPATRPLDQIEVDDRP